MSLYRTHILRMIEVENSASLMSPFMELPQRETVFRIGQGGVPSNSGPSTGAEPVPSNFGAGFYNIINIRSGREGSGTQGASTGAENSPHGNYDRDYEIVQTAGRLTNNRSLVATASSFGTGAETYFDSEYLTGTVDFVRRDRQKNNHIIVSTFYGMHGPETHGIFATDRDTEEYNLYNTMNYRNSMVRGILNELSAEHSRQFGLSGRIRSGVYIPSFHKVHRNPKRLAGAGQDQPIYDNLFVQNHMPQNDFGYCWISKSSSDTVYQFLEKNANYGHQHSFSISGSLESSETLSFITSSSLNSKLDFLYLNTHNSKSLDLQSGLITNFSNSLNSILLNNNGPYGWPSWKQIRNSYNPLVRAYRKNNIFTTVFRDTSPNVFALPGTKWDYKNTKEDHRPKTKPRTIKQYKEVPVTNRYYPLVFTIQPTSDTEILNIMMSQGKRVNSQQYSSMLWNIDWAAASEALNFEIPAVQTIVQSSIQNNLTSYSNEEFRDEKGYFETDFLDSKDLHDLNMFIREAVNNQSGLDNSYQLNYTEKIYPLEVNTYTSVSRDRERFVFFGWNPEASQRTLKMSGNIEYSNFLFPNINMFPDIAAVKEESEFDKSYYNRYDSIDLNNFNNSASFDKLNHLTQSTWVLDSRANFAQNPVNITQSFFNNSSSFMESRSQGTRGAGILQNDFSLFPLGINALLGAPPIAPLYSRRVIQNYNSDAYLAGEAKWEAADNHPVGPFYKDYDTYSEEVKLVGQDYSLVPEFRISKYVDDILTTLDEDKITENMQDFLEVTGALYHTSSEDVQIGRQFFKTYSNSEFLKYFKPLQKNNALNNFNLEPTSLTLKCKAVKRFLPYRGFYPAERVVQLSEIFNKNYMPEGSFETEVISTQSLISSSAQADRVIRARIENSKAMALKPLLGPGVLMNSIKSGVAVDYPMFSSSVSQSLEAIKNNTTGSNLDMLNTHAVFGTGGLCFTGSVLNSSADAGIPRITGSISRRITFEDILDPSRLYNEVIYDNEPHPSSSLLYGSSFHFSVLERPARFGTLDVDQTRTNTGVEFKNTELQFSDKIAPFRSAVQNFCSETVNFFLNEGKLTTILSNPVSPRLLNGKQYKMFVYLENTGISTYDRHSSFGPPVDAGTVRVQRYEFATASTGVQASGSLKLTGSYSNASSLHGVDFTLKAVNSLERTYKFSTGSSPVTGQLDSGKYIIKIAGMNTSNILNEINTAITDVHSGSINVTVVAPSSSVTFTQAETGSVGNHSISKSGAQASNVSVLGFLGGQTGSITTSKFLSSTNVNENSSHGYLPYVPPFLDPKTTPYAEVSFTPSNTDNFSIKEIIEGSTITYYNMKAPSNPNTNTNYINSMNVGASLKLDKFVRLKGDNFSFETVDDPSGATVSESPIGNTDKYRWVIQTRWETPVLNFENVSSSILDISNNSVAKVNNSPYKTRFQDNYYIERSSSLTPYLTGSRGMWHQKGELLDHNSNKGYILGIAGPHVENEDAEIQNLAVALGFAPKESQRSNNAQEIRYRKTKLGKLSKDKKICEAVVAIPYYTDNKGKIILFSVSKSMLTKAKSFNKRRKDQFRINYRNKQNDYQSSLKMIQEYDDFYGDTGRSAVSSLAYQLRMLDKYVLPPQFDFVRNENVEAHVQFIFQFQANLKESDLAEMWQNLYPSSGQGASVAQHSRVFKNREDENNNRKESELDTEYVTCNINMQDAINNQSTFQNPEMFMKEKVRWLIFKSKFRGMSNYNKLVNKSISLFEEDIIKEEKDLITDNLDPGFFFNNYGYNWPYDYFSVVELAEVEAKIDFNPKGPTLEEQIEIEEAVEDLILEFTGAATVTTQVPEAVSADPKQTDFVAKNFITAVNSGSIDQITLSRTLKEAGTSPPSPANQITIDLPDGFAVIPGTESIFVNGVLQVQGAGSDYVLSTNTINFTYDLQTIDIVKANYIMNN